MSVDLVLQGELDLLHERRIAIAQVEANVDRKQVVFAQHREEPCQDERCLAQTRRAKEHGERSMQHQPPQLRNLVSPPIEEPLGRLVECFKPRPWVLLIDQELRDGSHATLARRKLRSCSRSSALSSSLICPAGAQLYWKALNCSGTSA